MLNYLKYMIRVPRKFILNWAISGGVYLLILPLAFANSSVESLLIDTQREATLAIEAMYPTYPVGEP